MIRKLMGLAVGASVLLPATGAAAPFEGAALSFGASSHALVVEAESSWSRDTSSANELGGMIDIGIGGRPGSSNFFAQVGYRRYPIEIGTTVNGDERVEVSDIGVLYVQLGGVINDRNLVYGVLESGSADASVQKTGYEEASGEIDVIGAGAGYKRWISDNAEFFVEGISRVYEESEVTYVDQFGSETVTYEPVGATVTAGFTVRF